ncbi:hypothetical protein QQS21_011008 [Conoideocrella luteorostrata]|uniref:Uncharacterized protein n=1 Tax=Conoideocrella luteorostrata TaxID=1105319 RepID=A0AAJ0CDW4_9HYPO|nr:hypothetical protein QQS21_011008 [Conoideocrella luteorostrata]
MDAIVKGSRERTPGCSQAAHRYWAREITITEMVVKAAAENRRNGKEVIALLLDRRGDEIIILEEVVKATAENVHDGKEVMALLLDQRGDEITIPEGLLV